MNKKFLTMTAILMLWSLFTIAQDEEAKSGRRQIRKARPYYIGFGVGMNRTSFRDFGKIFLGKSFILFPLSQESQINLAAFIKIFFQLKLFKSLFLKPYFG